MDAASTFPLGRFSAYALLVRECLAYALGVLRENGLVCPAARVRLQIDTGIAGDDMEVDMEHRLTRRRLVELDDSHAVGIEGLAYRLRGHVVTGERVILIVGSLPALCGTDVSLSCKMGLHRLRAVT